jgi:hypothetical protein
MGLKFFPDRISKKRLKLNVSKNETVYSLNAYILEIKFPA